MLGLGLGLFSNSFEMGLQFGIADHFVFSFSPVISSDRKRLLRWLWYLCRLMYCPSGTKSSGGSPPLLPLLLPSLRRWIRGRRHPLMCRRWTRGRHRLTQYLRWTWRWRWASRWRWTSRWIIPRTRWPCRRAWKLDVFLWS